MDLYYNKPGATPPPNSKGDDLPNLYKSLKECVSPYLRLIMRVRFLQGMSLDGSVFPAASCGFQWARDDDSDGSRRLVGVLFLR